MLETEPSKRHGVLLAVAAYGLWGVFPLYFKLLAHISPTEVIAWRCTYSFATLAIILTIVRRWDHFVACFRSRQRLGKLVLSTLMILSNWSLFIYAVFSGRVLESSLAYFINPLVSVLLGVIFLHERLRRLQLVSITLATVGVLIMTFVAGKFPGLALILAFSFGFYGFLRKTVHGVDGLTGLSVETCLATPFALLLLLLLKLDSPITHCFVGQSGPIALTTYDHLILLPIGIVTIAPLLLFITAARRLPLSVIGMLQYITPTFHFLMAIFLFGEHFSGKQFVSFCFIWLAVTIFLIDTRRKRTTPPI